MRSLGDFINETMLTSAPTVFIADSLAWRSVQEILKTLGINSNTVESVNKKKFIYGSRSSFNRAIKFFEDDHKQFIRTNIRDENKGYNFNENKEYEVGGTAYRNFNKKSAKAYLQESEKIQLFLLGSFLNRADSKYFVFESDKEKDHYAKKFRLFKLPFHHEINKKIFEPPVTPGPVYELEKRPLTEILLSDYRSALQSTGLRLYLYYFNEMHGDAFLFLNTLFIPPPKKDEYVDHVYILRHMAVDKNWKQITINNMDGKFSYEIGEGFSKYFRADFLSYHNITFFFNEYEVFQWVNENLGELQKNPNLPLPKDLLPTIDYAFEFERYQEVLLDDYDASGEQQEYDEHARAEHDRINREIDDEIEAGRHYELRSPIEDENARESDDFIGPDVPDSDDLLPGTDEDDVPEEAVEEDESQEISDAEIVNFFHKLNSKQVDILKKLIDIRGKTR